MSINKNTRPTVDLDFDGIKADIVAFIKGNPAFTDYNFEGSALNAIADILAFNTFNNAYYANMLHGESFIDSAQRRASVVSRAKELGYTPRSATCSTAYVDVDLVSSREIYPPYSLSRGDAFTSSNDNGSFVFSVVDDTVAETENLNHSFTNIKLVDGTRVQNSYKIDTSVNVRSIVTIPNKSIDISTLRVYIRDSIGALDRTEFKAVTDVFSVGPTDKVFYVQESYDGYYQIFFGNNVLGFQPVNGNVVDMDYFVCNNFSAADDCKTFVFSGGFAYATSAVVTTIQPSYGGSDKETIQSIKYNAIKANASKGRIVTENDYALEIYKKFPFIKSASIWGGENNSPPIYGKVFIALQTVNGYLLSDLTKRNVIIPELRKTSMMTVTPEIVDPYYTSMEFTTRLKFDQSKTVNNRATVENLVRNTIYAYLNSISKFDTDYLESDLIQDIVNADSGIVSADIIKTFGFDAAPIVGTKTRFTHKLNNQVRPGTLKSTKFTTTLTSGTYQVSLKEISIEGSMSTIGIVDESGNILEEVGTLNTSTGDIDLVITVSEYLTEDRLVEIRVVPEYDDIVVKRNQILSLNTKKNYANSVSAENYAK